jgi:preprotein translocase subunit SecF
MAYYTAPNKTVKRLSKSSGSSGSSDSSDSKLGSGISGLLKSPYLWAAILAFIAVLVYLKYRNQV